MLLYKILIANQIFLADDCKLAVLVRGAVYRFENVQSLLHQHYDVNLVVYAINPSV